MPSRGNWTSGGTPSFVIGRQVIRGARDLETLRRFVADARAAAKR